ncbi:RpnC/YadD family protein [Zavarzinella formosa]|uniref:hypothetical protein n=1 Tax=Zavarzinella formosa TaxID=360055 RepID=UPI0002D61E2B|nr:hypothetical protein [Zavarzinella formosa]
MSREFDGPWKETLDLFFERCIAFFFPSLHAQIDWNEPPVNLDTELQKILREGEIGAGRVDKLVRVKWLDGRYQWLYIHVEVQSQQDNELARRVFTYHTRLFHLYDQHPVNLVILGDDSPSWRPTGYNVPHLDDEIRLPFWSAKLLDYAGRWDELESHPNPVGMIVSAHLRSLMTADEPGDRLAGKVRLMRRLFTRGLDAKGVREMYKVIDWFLELPQEQTLTFDTTLRDMERELKMPYVSSIERAGIEKGLAEGRQLGMTEGKQLGMTEGKQGALAVALVIKFGEPGRHFAERHLKSADLILLDQIQDSLLSVNTLDELRQAVGISD